MKAGWAKWRIKYTYHSPYLRPDRISAAYRGRIRSPDFVIIGSERGGTTSLYNYLLDSSSVVPALRKEIHFFDQNYTKGLIWYLAHFPIRSDTIISGESSPHYYIFPEAAQRISHDLPNTSLIMLLRNPIDRAYSHYQHEVALGYEKQSFEEAIKREFYVDGSNWIPQSLRSSGISEYVHHSYLSKGLYAKHLRHWLDCIPRERFLMLKSETFFDTPEQVMMNVFDFLGVSSVDKISYRKYNEGHYDEINPELRSRLRRFYEPFNRELSDLLNMDFSDWT